MEDLFSRFLILGYGFALGGGFYMYMSHRHFKKHPPLKNVVSYTCISCQVAINREKSEHEFS